MPNISIKDLPVASTGMAMLCLLLATTPTSIAHLLEYNRPAVLAGEIWRLWTCHVVHYSTQHMLGDVGALLLIGLTAERVMGSRSIALALLVGAPSVSVAFLVATPGMEYFRGASSLPVILAVATAMVLWNTAPELRQFLLLCSVLLSIKLILEAFGVSFTLTGLPKGIRVAWQAHLAAIAIGVLWGWFSSKRHTIEKDLSLVVS